MVFHSFLDIKTNWPCAAEKAVGANKEFTIKKKQNSFLMKHRVTQIEIMGILLILIP